MGQEIAYCALCGCQLRSADFEKGGAFRVDLQSYCKKCAPEAVKSLPSEKIQAILKQGNAPKKAAPEGSGQPITSRAFRLPSEKSGPPQSMILVATAATVLAGAVALFFVFSSSRPAPEAPQARIATPPRPPAGPAPVAVKPPEPAAVPRPTPAPATSAEELRTEEARKKLDEIKASESRIPPDEVRRKYVEFARAYSDTPQGKTIEGWLKSTEPKPAEPAPVVAAPVEPIKPPEPAKTPPPEPAPAPPPAEPAASPAAPASKRPAVPAAPKLKEAEAAYQKAFRPDQVKTAPEKAKLAKTLLGTATSSGAKDAELYILLREARELAAAGLDPATALEAIDARAAAFDIDPVAETIELFSKTAKGATAAAWAGPCLDAAERMAESDEIDAALKLAARAEAFARSANDKALETSAKERGRDYADLKRAAEGIRTHFKTLETKPDDPASNVAVGKFYCLVKGDWKRGLPMLLKSSEAAWKNVAELELSKPTEAAAEAAVGEAWAALADKETPLYKARARSRAADWLGRAIPRLTGLAKVSAEKTLAGLGSIAAPKERLALDLGSGVKLELVAIKPGSFTMGGTMAPSLEWQADERPEHRVTLTRGYLLGKYEVTRGQFALFVKATAYKTDAERDGKTFGRPPGGGWVEIPGLCWLQPGFPQTDEHPAVLISWNDAKAFCDWAAKKTGRSVRLPTEAEWEYACRAGTRTKYTSGDDDAGLLDWAWTATNTGESTRPVGQKKLNAWGLFDMHGNAWEWCQDWAGPYTGDAVDPTGPSGGDRHLLRGGGCSNPAIDCRSSYRLRFYPVDRTSHFGFRVAVN